MSKKLKILFVMFISIGFLTSVLMADTITVTNPSFESGTTGWSGATTSNSEFYSPVDGTRYATRSGGSGYTTQLTGHTIGAGDVITLKVWARSTNGQGTTSATNAEARLYYGSTTINAVTQDVNPVRLSGAPDSYPNDDGANVWIDQGYRMEFADNVFYQAESADPLYDSWSRYNDSDYDTDMANGQIITSQGFKGLYSTFYEDSPPYYSEIWLKSPTGSPPNYNWPAEPEAIILSHAGDEDPWVIDAHVFQDPATGKVWMSWGGLPLRVSELDPTDGMLVNHPADDEYDTHPGSWHTAVANWNGDEWSSDWAEGPALYKHNGYWYFFGSYGNLAANYTIRGGRGSSPTGPYYDKDGVNLMSYDSGESEYGNTIFLGHDGGQTNPGHPHIWEESGTFYMGYDYVEEYSGGNGTDTMGIRRLYWVNDWPTIWTPITVTFNANDYPGSIGQELGISLRNTGSGSNAAFDHVSLDYTGGAPDTDPPSPDPMTWASVPTADDQDSISMTATTATDASGVEYYFDETTGGPGGSDSGWQDPASYTDAGLNSGTQYCYEVAARDKSTNQNETAASSNQCATTDSPDTTPPTPDPMTWATLPHATGSSSIDMTATTASDPSGVQYYFDETSGNPGGSDSSWQSSPSYTDSGLDPLTQYTYTVKARDVSPAQNETAVSTAESATTEAVPPEVSILGSWTSGTSHTVEAGSTRALIFTAHAEDDNADMDASVTYGGQSMTKVVEYNEGAGYRAYAAAFILDEAGIVAAGGSSTFNVTWAQSPSRTPAYSSVFLEGVDQTTPVGANDGNGGTTGTVTTSALATGEGDMVVLAGTCGATGTYSTNNGFTEAIELTVESGDGVAGYKAATGADETPSITHSAANRQAIVGLVVQSGGAAPPDTDPPTPDPMTWATTPYATGQNSISMVATTASDVSGVEYYFMETSANPGGSDSDWQDSTSYTDSGLNAGTQYCYEVQARDKSANQNLTNWSTNQCATTDTPDTTPPTPDPMTWQSVPSAGSDTAVSMTATTASDPSGVEYFFDETSGNPGGSDSGWQDPASYTDTGLTGSTQYCYRVQARDKSVNQNATAYSTTECATTQATPDTTPPTPDPMTWDVTPVAGGTDNISMTAATATDPSGVEYQFDETSGNPGGTDSGWQDPANYTDTGLNASTQYCYRVQARDKSVNQNTTAYSSTQCATTDALPDTDPPTPDPMTWASVPSADSDTAISMTATTATDPSGVEYLFDETSGNPGGSDSAWQDSTSYTDSGLTAETQYCYRVQARDKSPNQNATAWSSPDACATTLAEPDTTPPTPDPATWASVPAAGGTDNISMTATTGSDPSGVQYQFDETTGNPGGSDSGWQSSASYTDTGLTPDTMYTYRVRMRDESANQNTGSWSTSESDTTDPLPQDTDPPTPDPMTWSSVPSADSDTAISMTATTATDPSGVQYYFDETSGNSGGSDSGWQSPASYTDSGLSESTQYCYQVKARDQSVNQNETASSTSECATTQSKGSCGAAPMYRDGVLANASVMSSFGNALLPLIPSLLTLGLWTVIKRKRD